MLLGSQPAVAGTDGLAEFDLAPYAAVVSPALDGVADGFVQPLSALRADARIDILSRGSAERQADVTVRGGIFEGTGFQLGGLQMIDPQTGHYFAELPLDPAFLSGPRLLTGVDAFVRGVNATSGTVQYQWLPAQDGGVAEAGGGGHGLLYGRLNGAVALAGGRTAGAGQWFEVGVARSEGNGTVRGGDFAMERISARWQVRGEAGQTDVFVGYMDKFYGWPALYTGNPNLLETDHYQVLTVGAHHQWRSLGGSHAEGGVYYRRLVDDYEFNRLTPNTFFEHTTELAMAQATGTAVLGTAGAQLEWQAALWADRIVRSTALRFGRYDRREYARLAVLPGWRRDVGSGELTVRGGLALDTNNRNSTQAVPAAGIGYRVVTASGEWHTQLEFTALSRVPGYTALASNPVGLFGGNPDLNREHAKTGEWSVVWRSNRLPFTLRSAVFQRDDKQLTDWTYRVDQPGRRQANPVDVRVRGIEFASVFDGKRWQAYLQYALLDKEATYGSAVDASFYVLNFARHRLTAGLTVLLPGDIQLQGGVEWRDQAPNALRRGRTSALRSHAAVTSPLPWVDGLQLIAKIDNLGDVRFEDNPGTPGAGRAWSAGLTFRW
jgi:vitamin B12 transporter